MNVASEHRVLILGAGLVTRPIVRFFLDCEDVRLTVATLIPEDAEKLIDGHPRGAARGVDVSDAASLQPLIGDADLVISLVPFAFHAGVARVAIDHRIPLVTTSYVSPEMRALDGDAQQAGVLLLNEVGLDPGLDHMAAVCMIEEVRRAGGTVEEFHSCCGGLPSPEAADNPWRYKFSWSPRGALLASRLDARYLENGEVEEVPGPELFGRYWPLEIEGLGSFEVYPNRDSLSYIERYRLEGVKDMLRGTIRYPGWCDTMKVVADLGLLEIEERDWPGDTSLADLIASRLPAGDGPVDARLASWLGKPANDPILSRFRWAGLFEETPIERGSAAPLDLLAACFQARMVYAPGERDMVIQRHRVTSRLPDGGSEHWLSEMVAYGEPGGDSATSRTVSLPAAQAARLVLDGVLTMKGVRIPNRIEIAKPILERLEPMGISFRETTEAGDPPKG